MVASMKLMPPGFNRLTDSVHVRILSPTMPPLASLPSLQIQIPQLMTMINNPFPRAPRSLPFNRNRAPWKVMKCAIACLLLGGATALAQVAGAIAVYPGNSTLEYNTTRQFSAYVPISPNTIVWLINDVVGGDATVGTISATGLYTPPATIPANNVFTVKARSTAFPSSSGSATLTITRKYPWIWSASPSKPTPGNYQLSFNGANFAPDSQVLANGAVVPSIYVSPTKLLVNGTALQTGTLSFAVRQPAPGAVTGNTLTVPVNAAAVTVAVAPSAASVALGASQTFSSTVTGTANTALTWTVNGVVGGAPDIGTITSVGLYTAPSVMPASTAVTIRATSVASPATYAQAVVTLIPPPATVTVSPPGVTMQVGTSQAFIATVTGNPNTAVTWAVNGTVGGSATVGTITSAGVYTAPAAPPTSGPVLVRATSVASPSSYAQVPVTLTLPPPPAVWLTGARFLEQSSFGPSPASLAQVQQTGIDAYLEDQFNMAATPIPTPAGNSMGELRRWLLYNYSSAPDQLRQRVAYSLSQIIVTSANKLINADEILPWLQLLSQHAFGNYRDLLHDVTLSPTMGKYLDLANSLRPGLAGGANENYARELMQLFTIGLWKLNMDGSQVLDGNNQPVPTYDQQTVRQVALALTGWTYATAPGATPRSVNWEYFGAPMESRQVTHDLTEKNFLGRTLPAGQTVEKDLEDLLDCLMTHPNTAPFVATRLIRSLVMSNPSPGYIQRVATVFVDNGSGVRGDLKAVIRAILLDAEARQDVATTNQGRLKEPILQVCGFLRALGGQFKSDQQITYVFDYMAQSVLTPPSVFGWFSPGYRVPKSPLFGPEFQIYSPTEAVLRGNLFYYLLTSQGADATIDLNPFQPYANDMAGLVEAVNQKLLYGRMPVGMKQVLIDAATPGYSPQTRIETVLYLVALSGQYAVQH